LITKNQEEANTMTFDKFTCANYSVWHDIFVTLWKSLTEVLELWYWVACETKT